MAILSAALMLIGATFMLVAAIGVLRMPDLFTRMHSSTKSPTLGIACLMLGAALHFGTVGIAARALAIVVFAFVTAPVAAHMIGRAAYFLGVPQWEGTLSDDLRGLYNMRTHTLASPPAPSPPAAPPLEEPPTGG